VIQHRLFIFGSFVLDSRSGLYRAEKPVPIPPKELTLLDLLGRKHGQLVTHREIESRAWPRQIVSYASLARCVYSLRRLLSSDGINYIQTVHKQGYRLAVPVKEVESSRGEKAVLQSISTIPLAYSHYIAGVREANDPRPAGQIRAIRLFEAAAQEDPSFAAALASVADTRIYQAIRGQLVPGAALKLGLDACRRALDVNPTLVQANAALAWFKGVMLSEFDEAHALLDAAHSIDPDYSRGYVYRSWIFRCQGLADESAMAAQQAVVKDPHSILNRHSYSWALFCAGRADEALVFERELRKEYPLDEIAQGYVGIMAAYLGKQDEARAAIETAMHLSDGDPSVCAGFAYILAHERETEGARQMVNRATEAISPRAPRPQVATAYARLGDVDRAFDLLFQARDERCAWYAPARLDPRLTALKSDERFSTLFS